MSDIREVLLDLGYKIQDHGREFRMSPLYRDSGSSSVLRVYEDTGWWTDFKENKAGPFEELVRMSLGLSSIEKAREIILKKYKFTKAEREEAKLEHVKQIPKYLIEDLVEDHSYWEGRGISKDTLTIFNGGKSVKDKLYGRYVFPIYNGNKKLVGVTGRDTTNKNPLKWLHQGATSKWAYPLQVNFTIIQKAKEVILVESIGDMLSLWEAGIKNTLVTFGLRISSHLVTCILKLNPNKIIIAFNNDEEGGAGNKAAYKASKLLDRHFDEGVVKIKLPSKNDFGCMNKKEILEWQKS